MVTKGELYFRSRAVSILEYKPEVTSIERTIRNPGKANNKNFRYEPITYFSIKYFPYSLLICNHTFPGNYALVKYPVISPPPAGILHFSFDHAFPGIKALMKYPAISPACGGGYSFQSLTMPFRALKP